MARNDWRTRSTLERQHRYPRRRPPRSHSYELSSHWHSFSGEKTGKWDGYACRVGLPAPIPETRIQSVTFCETIGPDARIPLAVFRPNLSTGLCVSGYAGYGQGLGKAERGCWGLQGPGSAGDAMPRIARPAGADGRRADSVLLARAVFRNASSQPQRSAGPRSAWRVGSCRPGAQPCVAGSLSRTSRALHRGRRTEGWCVDVCVPWTLRSALCGRGYSNFARLGEGEWVGAE